MHFNDVTLRVTLTITISDMVMVTYYMHINNVPFKVKVTLSISAIICTLIMFHLGLRLP